ncbi:MAG: citramalate synthase [Chloroflexi bacterium AL-W]|nr:citramalate synthase [Chloroflexi bacterium AL-N1]NOK67520.1 citramalate synthase [Chloroflexi bacterium AL-N10]NOK74988.1 citramalate synthase [Chloroflexi bacterium AL-N5]NOK81775.1 citramalate synthase [Chloroflexi bacterium AL-W]NOK89621.1 citramalate synthase [Chloroflexi bacterium AL-N15]
MSILLYDTTLRDGTQREGLSLSVEDKLKIADELDALGVHYIEGGWPGSNPKDAAFFQRIAETPLRTARVAAFGSTRHAHTSCEDDANIRALVDAQTPVVTLVGKSSVLHVEKVLETTRDENVRMIADSVAYFKQMGKEVVYDAEHFFDGYKLDAAYTLSTLAVAAQAGADCLVLCDTNGGSLPEEVSRAVQHVHAHLAAQYSDVAALPRFGIHTHNDGALAVANAMAAVQAGCTHVQGTINGYGERCGNMDLIPLIANLQIKLGYDCVAPEQLQRLSEVSHYVAAIANLNPDSHAPYVGRSAFAHKGGIHVAAIAKVAESYQHIEPELVGNELRVVVSELSGRGNVRIRAEALGLPLNGNERTVLQRIKELESDGFQFEAAEGSFEMLIRRASPDYRPPFTLLDFTVIVEQRGNNAMMSQATVKLQVGDERMHTAAEGDGPVNALDQAIRKALVPHYPELADVKLVDYKVRIIDEHLGTAAKPRVMIESARGEERWSTVGCSENIIEASWQALWDSLELPLLRWRDGQPSAAVDGQSPDNVQTIV